MSENILSCPVCGNILLNKDRTFRCTNGHSFDEAREGYLNLLLSNRHKSRHPGDSPESCTARHSFLSAGYYEPLADAVSSLISSGTVLDACCGEGYYTGRFSKGNRTVYGFDISKDMIRLAAKKNKNAKFIVAGLNNIPVMTESIDTVTHLFAPMNDAEFSRILKKDGRLIDVIPGKDHLMGLKKVLYDEPYRNPVNPIESDRLHQSYEQIIRYDITVEGENIENLFLMTPYAYKTSQKSAEKIREIKTLETTVEFVIRVFDKKFS